MGFSDTVGDYVTGDVSLRATHLFDTRTVIQMAYAQAPHPVVWAVSSVGTLLGFTYAPEEQVAGWHEHDLGGADQVESVTVVAEGTEDRVYIVAQRNGTRYVERMGSQSATLIQDQFFVDWGGTYSGTPLASLFFPHLAGSFVHYLADGVAGTATVSAQGILTLPTAASKVHVGLQFFSELRTLPVGLQVDAALGSGRTKNINAVWLRVVASGPFDVGPSVAPAALSTYAPTSGQLLAQVVPVLTMGEWTDDGQVTVLVDDPLPLTVVGLTLEVASGG
jgi:hypothetical protein